MSLKGLGDRLALAGAIIGRSRCAEPDGVASRRWGSSRGAPAESRRAPGGQAQLQVAATQCSGRVGELLKQPGAASRDVDDDVRLQLGDRRPEVVVDATGGAQLHPGSRGQAGGELGERVDSGYRDGTAGFSADTGRA